MTSARYFTRSRLILVTSSFCFSTKSFLFSADPNSHIHRTQRVSEILLGTLTIVSTSRDRELRREARLGDHQTHLQIKREFRSSIRRIRSVSSFGFSIRLYLGTRDSNFPLRCQESNSIRPSRQSQVFRLV